MNLIDGRYLKHEICAFSGDWLIVYDGKYNYMLFNASAKANIVAYNRNRLPSNHIGTFGLDGVLHGGLKCIEYYSNFGNACDNLMRVVVSGSFKPTFLREVFA